MDSALTKVGVLNALSIRPRKAGLLDDSGRRFLFSGGVAVAEGDDAEGDGAEGGGDAEGVEGIAFDGVAGDEGAEES